MPQAFQREPNRSLARPKRNLQIHAPVCNGASLDRADSARGQYNHPLFGSLQLTGIDLAIGPMQLQFKGQLLPALPRVLRQQRRTGGEIRPEAYADDALARLPAIRFISASCSRSSGDVISGAPRLSWLTISKMLSLRFSSTVSARSSRPIVKCASARDVSGSSA